MLINIRHHSCNLGDTIALAHTLYALAYQKRALINIVHVTTSKAPQWMHLFEGMAHESQKGFHPDAWWRYGPLVEDAPVFDVFASRYEEGIIHGPRKALGVTLTMKAPVRAIPPVLGLHPYVVVSPYASGRAKEIPYEDWQPVIDTYVSKGYKVVVVGPRTIEEKRWTNAIYANTWDNPLVLLAIVQHASMHIGLSSGNSWLADACGVPTIRLNSFCDSAKEFVPSYQIENAHTCRNCYDKGLMTNYHHCPLNKNRECTNTLGYQTVQLIKALS